MERAKAVAGKTPKKILTDGWKGYIDGIEAVFGGDTQHIQTTTFADKNESTNMVEWWQGTLKERTKVMRGLKTFDSINEFLKGWVIHYNYFRPHLSLNDKTPAQEAKIDFPYANWQELIEKLPYSVTARIPIKKEIKVIESEASLKLSPDRPRITRLNKSPGKLEHWGRGRFRTNTD